MCKKLSELFCRFNELVNCIRLAYLGLCIFNYSGIEEYISLS